ncbi:hypothetical protein IT774_04210 [Salinimonas marina]|uniref:Sulfotransferase n=1 Tax=Salinimonas marina TaxID=2785918 RepID=A0A7S9DYN5_9ALTE|nr:sulfotransferase [Salinimonas marina]QPG06402.1 hypothetical protein IT774_04210 [Salinimonas marina]
MQNQEMSTAYSDAVARFNKSQYKILPRKLFQKRQFQAFCIGTPKSGTHSVDTLCSAYRSRHEPDEKFMISFISQLKNGQVSTQDAIDILKKRDYHHWLEMESSHYCGEIIEPLYEAFPKAQYILTVRDCVSWVDSWFNHQLARKRLPEDSIFSIGRANYYDMGLSYSRHDRFLEELGLYPLKAYLTYWANRNAGVLNTIAPSQLLILQTNQISKQASLLASFLGIQPGTLQLEKAHQFKAKEKFHIINRIDKHYLEDSFEEICGEVHSQTFPEVSINGLIEKKLARADVA